MDDLKTQTHKAVKDPHMRQKITALAQREGISFNDAMKIYINSK